MRLQPNILVSDDPAWEEAPPSVAGGRSEADPRTVRRGQGLCARAWEVGETGLDLRCSADWCGAANAPGAFRSRREPLLSTWAVRREWHPRDVLPAVARSTGKALTSG